MRALCLVPPEWSDVTLLVRARVIDALLAWRGLANSVATPAAAGGSTITMPHQNDTSERRINQLFVLGLAALPQTSPGLCVEQEYPLVARESLRGSTRKCGPAAQRRPVRRPVKSQLAAEGAKSLAFLGISPRITMGLRIVVNQCGSRFTARSIIRARTNNFAAIPFLAPRASSRASRLFRPRASSVSSEAAIRSGDIGVHGESKGNTISPLRCPAKQ
jgi:hypothetical protein